MRELVALVLALSLVGCSDGGVTSTSTAPSSTTSPTSTTVPPSSTTQPTGSTEDLPALALYLAAIERGVEGTDLEGAAFEEPEALIETGILFCGLLDEGVSPVDVLRGWVAALSAGGATPLEDELLLGGVVLGAAVRFICPEHTESLEL